MTGRGVGEETEGHTGNACPGHALRGVGADGAALGVVLHVGDDLEVVGRQVGVPLAARRLVPQRCVAGAAALEHVCSRHSLSRRHQNLHV